ncbi:olfactory receptor 2K2-like [Rhinatrema bivittatum]|uniref:olfactory receptor 2K2-like n=1 Tax=Rhinatrema bivittatum TaxID=194408 RepID=UPI00112E1DD4|nr:olfactory receptor 2K2-like [Rhinatrema bivittatum]
MLNETRVNEFLLLGLSTYPKLWAEFFVLFLTLYLMTLLGNSLIITAIAMDSRLQTPMYFFLSNLSILELCYTSVTMPNILASLLKNSNTISSSACFAQTYLFTLCATTECLILTMMAYDRYVAICIPLRYMLIMNKQVCLGLAAMCWFCGVLNSVIETFPVTLLPYCGPNGVDRMYCEIEPLLKLSCSDPYLNKILMSASAIFFGICCLILILISYVYITAAILRIPSAEGRRKAFSTCASHITVVALYYGALIFMYLRPTSSSSHKMDSMVSTIYCIVIPVLNPIIYSLRNKEVKRSLKKAIEKCFLIACKGLWNK